MAEFSKVALRSLPQLLLSVLIGSKKKKIISGTALLIILFLLYIYHRSPPTQPLRKGDKQQKKQGKGEVDGKFLKRILQLVRIVIPSWKCIEVLDLTLLTVFLVLRTFLSIYLATVNAGIVKAIIEQDYSLFLKRVLGLGLISLPASFVNSFLDFLNRRLALNFRRRLTNHFHRVYLQDMIFYQISNLDSRIPNPDQRLTADIEKWATSLSTIYSNATKPLLDIVLFSRKLAELVGWSGPIAVMAWYLFSAILLKVVSPPFGQLIATEQRLEGEYRSAQTSLVQHAEEVAFLRGNEWERVRIQAVFARFLQHSESIMHKKLYMGVFDSMLVKYGAFMVGNAVLGLPVFGRNAAAYNATVASSNVTRDYIRNSSLLVNLAKAIGKLVISYKEVQRLAGFTSLIHEMKTVLQDLEQGRFKRKQVTNQPGTEMKEYTGGKENMMGSEDCIGTTTLSSLAKGRTMETEDYISLERVPIVSPNGDVLVAEMSFSVKRGMNTVITGPNGCGKSSLFRILSGLWPLTGGVLQRPHIDKLFYIPQRPYLPLGTLRDQIIYPHEAGGRKATDAELKVLLEWVKLEYLEKREGSLDAVNDWNDVLSGGEKQCLAMARLFYHKPLFAILDECTSAMSAGIETELYTRTKDLHITLFTVSHRRSLYRFHDHMLKFSGRGTYEMMSLEQQ